METTLAYESMSYQNYFLKVTVLLFMDVSFHRHIRGRVLVALADNSVALFRRTTEGQWSLDAYHLLVMPSTSPTLRTMTLVGGDTLWAAFGNKIHIIDPRTLNAEVGEECFQHFSVLGCVVKWKLVEKFNRIVARGRCE